MRALLLLLSALILLETTDGVKYDTLEDHDRKIVDEAIKKANEMHGKPKHLDLSTILRPNGKTLNVILKPTSCNDKTEKVHQKNCKIQDKAKPQISCVACRRTMTCILLKEKQQIKTAINECSAAVHQTGGAHTMFQKDNKGETGCLGCI